MKYLIEEGTSLHKSLVANLKHEISTEITIKADYLNPFPEVIEIEGVTFCELHYDRAYKLDGIYRVVIYDHVIRNDSIIKSDEHATKLLDEWTERLGLTHYMITLEYDVEDMDAWGDIDIVNVSRTAKIRICSPESDVVTVRKFDAEVTLVHELLHIVLYETGELIQRKQMELTMHPALQDIAIALVAAKRGKGRHITSNARIYKSECE